MAVADGQAAANQRVAKRNEIIVPDAAHGTNPATATMCGCVVKELHCEENWGSSKHGS